ncbi:MAG: PEP-CTERM sorting domain-containing protein [Pontiellaceae bacterium]|nr:PEP-CTERM sorting domain-containing protein [Pontiellaceae bacterium]
MNKYSIAAWCAAAAISAGAAVTFDLYNDADLYSYLDDQTGPLSYTNSGIAATFSGTGGNMNRVSNNGFGIDAPGSGDTTYLLDVNEALTVSFNQAVQITALDFRNFDDGESIRVIIGSVTNTVLWANLGNKTTDSIIIPSWDVPLGDTVRFEVGGETDAIAIDSFTVVPEPATVSMLGIGGLLALIIRRISSE